MGGWTGRLVGGLSPLARRQYSSSAGSRWIGLGWPAATTTYLLDVVVEAGLKLVVEDALTLDAEVEAVQYVPETTHLLSERTQIVAHKDKFKYIKKKTICS